MSPKTTDHQSQPPTTVMPHNSPENSAIGATTVAEAAVLDTVPVPSVPTVPSFSPQAAWNVITLLQTLFALSNTAVAVPAVQEPVAARNVPLPQFGAASSPFAGKLLHNQFPKIEARTLLEIVHHDFKLDDLFKLSLQAHDKTDPNQPEGSKKMSGPYSAYPLLHLLLTPLTTYFSVLQSFAASSGDASAALSIGIGGQHYFAHILKLAPVL